MADQIDNQVESIERLFEEVDRQLDDVREQATALATRAGLVLTVAGIGAAVLGSRIQREAGDYLPALWPLGAALIVSLGALAPTFSVGPNPTSLAGWKHSDTAQRDLYAAKLLVLGGNRTRLTIMTCAFYLECLAVTVALVLTLVVAGRA